MKVYKQSTLKRKIKIVLLLFILTTASSYRLYSQGASTFDDLSLASDTFWNGSDGAGEFKSGYAFFMNSYNTKYKSWSGFAYSNTSDVTTGSHTNQYSAFTGNAHSSNNYAIANGSGATIILDEDSKTQPMKGIFLTNTTYSALIVKNGNAFSKKFGGSSGNDPDWFKLKIYGFKQGKATKDTVEIFLADYRPADNSKDIILNTWKWFDLSPLGIVDSIKFAFSSSDVGIFGMNTPAYVAVDDFNSDAPITSVSEINKSSLIGAFPNPCIDQLSLIQYENVKKVAITDVTGNLVHNVFENFDAISVSDLQPGVYTLNVFSDESPRHVQFIKK